MRFRDIYMVFGGILVLFIWFLTDPDLGLITSLKVGGSTIATIVILLKSVLYVGILHLSRKALLDYLDLKKIFDKAMESAEGAGHASIAVALVMVAVAIVMFAATVGAG